MGAGQAHWLPIWACGEGKIHYKWVLVCSQVPDTLRNHSQTSIECAKIIFIGHTCDVHTWEQDKLTGCLFGCVHQENQKKTWTDLFRLSMLTAQISPLSTNKPKIRKRLGLDNLICIWHALQQFPNAMRFATIFSAFIFTSQNGYTINFPRFNRS